MCVLAVRDAEKTSFWLLSNEDKDISKIQKRCLKTWQMCTAEFVLRAHVKSR